MDFIRLIVDVQKKNKLRYFSKYSKKKLKLLRIKRKCVVQGITYLLIKISTRNPFNRDQGYTYGFTKSDSHLSFYFRLRQ